MVKNSFFFSYAISVTFNEMKILNEIRTQIARIIVRLLILYENFLSS